MKTTNRILALCAAVLLAIAVAACGSDDSSSSDKSSSSGGGGGTSSKEIQKVSGAASKGTITVGSKNFPEQYILGNIYADALTAAGFKVKKSLDIGSEVLAYKALKQGEIDAYPEYTGTVLTAFFQVPVNKVPKDANAAYNEVKRKTAAEKVTALPRTPFENTYRLAITKETAKKLGNPKTNSDLKGKEGDLTIAGFPECKQRIDCLLGVEKVYGLKFGKFIASQAQYGVLDNGSADVLFGFTTDGELTTGKYVLLDDDKNLWPPYQVTFLMRDDALKKIGPEGQKVIEAVQKPLTVKVMGELNSRVVLDKQEPEKVAQQYLKEAGFIK
jgi:glycine betaine/choline ABC-type transport system substrate-binding protein